MNSLHAPDPKMPSFSAKIEAEVERAYGVVAKIKLHPELSYLRDQVISINDNYVATDKVVKRANKVGATRKASSYNLTVWVEVESKDCREKITQCCQGKCKGKTAIAFFRTFAVLVPDSLEFEVPIIFFGAPSHNHRGKKAKFILKMQIYENNNILAESTDCVIPYKQSSSKKRQRTKAEEESDIDCAGSQGNSTPSSPPLPYDNNTSYSYSPKRQKSEPTSSLGIRNLFADTGYYQPYVSFEQQTQHLQDYHDFITQQSLYTQNGCVRSNSLNDIHSYAPSTQNDDSNAAVWLQLVGNQSYVNWMNALSSVEMKKLLANPDQYFESLNSSTL